MNACYPRCSLESLSYERVTEGVIVCERCGAGWWCDLEGNSGRPGWRRAPVERMAHEDGPTMMFVGLGSEPIEMVPAARMERDVRQWKIAACVSSSLLACALVGSWAWWLI